MGQFTLEAGSGGDTWHIFLQPSSPLATLLQADSEDSQSPAANLAELEKYILSYLNSFQPEADRPQPDMPAPVKAQLEAVICIRADQEHESDQFSGFMVDGQGLILSTAHGLKNTREAVVTLFDGRQYQARLLKKDLARDLALLRIDFQPAVFIPLLSEGRNILKIGERLYAVGCPQNEGVTVYSGTIDGPPRRANNLPLWQIDMPISPGSSGSPVFDAQGNVVAVVKGKFRGDDKVGFMIPFETIIDFLQDRSL
ncbi:MAG: serine protease [Desulfobacterales bacterium]|nr:MAG: serine protease [Desulfobacterales bacterium]